MIKDFIRDQDNIINKAINSVTSLFNIKRYGIKSCLPDNCYDYNLIKFELLNYQLEQDDEIIIPEVTKIYWGYYIEDPYNIILALGKDDLQFSKNYSPDSSIFLNLDFSGYASGKYLVLKEPVVSTVKQSWDNTSFNYGVIPDQVFRSPVIYNGYRYYVSRNIVYLPVENSLISFS